LKNLARISFAAVALAAVLGSTSCAASTQPAIDGSAPAAVSAPSAAKAAGFTEKLSFTGAPEAWTDGAGWSTVTGPAAETVAVIGDYAAYLDGVQYGSATDVNASVAGTLVVVNGKGEIVYKATPIASGHKVYSSGVESVFKDGKQYLVYTETVKRAADPTSVKVVKDGYDLSSVTVLDENAKEVFKKELPEGQWASANREDDAIRVHTEGKPEISLLDVSTGEIAPEPKLSGSEWLARVNGVDIFWDANSSTVTNGTWSFTDKMPSQYAESTPTVVGNFVRVTTNSDQNESLTIDPRTGEEAVVNGEKINGSITSPNRNIVNAQSGGFISISDKKFYPITEDMSFRAESIADNGDVYGLSDGADKRSHAYANVLTADEPKVVPGTKVNPTAVTASGLAIFGGEEDSPAGDKSSSFIVKK
jgi:hypothetical protein